MSFNVSYHVSSLYILLLLLLLLVCCLGILLVKKVLFILQPFFFCCIEAFMSLHVSLQLALMSFDVFLRVL